VTTETGRFPHANLASPDSEIARLDAFHRLSATERHARGLAASVRVPHRALELGDRAAARQDPIAILERQAASRLPALVPVRYGRMVSSPFVFYRGAAAVMASDLAAGATSGLHVQLCGDAHLSNFGVYRSPERQLVFDCNDFDETLPGPFEWDVKRLAASLEIAGRQNGFSRADCRAVVVHAVNQYRVAISRFVRMGSLNLWYADLGVIDVLTRVSSELKRSQQGQARKVLAKATTRDSMHAYKKLTTSVDGRPRIASAPPLIVPIDELVSTDLAATYMANTQELLERYAVSVRSDVRHLVSQFRVVDVARKVVGVGSVGTRALIVLLLGPDDAEPLFLQVKEAQASVLEDYLGRAEQEQHGARVVAGQLLMQAWSDIFLGWLRAPGIEDGIARDFYVRQLYDGKLSLVVEAMDPTSMRVYARVCAQALARAHACSGDRIAIAAYLGTTTSFDNVMAAFAAAYADRNERDHLALRSAIGAGRVAAIEGV
jgi:uncharacterized protein (DUF2252 family)